MVAKQNCAKLTTVITGASHCLLVFINTNPKYTMPILHNKKLPSCPSQKQASRYLNSSERLLCCQAYLYSKR